MKSRLLRAAACLPFVSLFLCFQNPLRSQDVILQGFYWNTHPGDVTNTTTAGIWWDTLSAVAPQLGAAGFQTVWTPPPTKSFAGVWDMGYGTYDYFDLGSLPSKGTTRTRHGNRAQLDNMIGALHTNGLNVMCDVVLNHRGGADAQAMYQVGGNTGYNVFNPPSSRIPSGPAHVHPNNFHPDNNPDYHNAIFFEDLCYFNENDANPPTNPDGSPGSWFFGAPTLMGSMGDSLIMWGRWLANDVGFDELRLDAVKHIDPWFVKKFLIESNNGAQPFAVGESFDYGLSNLSNYWAAVQHPDNSGGVKNAKISLFDFPLRGALKSVLNDGSGASDLYNTLGGAGLVWATAMGGFDVVTWLESHDTDRQGYVGATSGCPIPAGAACLELHTENDHDPIVSDKEDMGYPFLLAAEGRPVVFWKDWFWYGLSEDIEWQIALRAATATGTSDHIQNMGGDWNLGAPFTPNNHGGNMFALRRNGLSGGVSDGLVLGLNDDPNTEHAVWVNTPFTNKYLKDYSDGYLFQSTQAFGNSRALIKAQPRDYSWWSPTGLYPKPAGTPASHFNMGATPGGCPHFIAICAADAANLIVSGARIAVGDEVAVKNAAGQVVGIGRIGQGFKWDGTHDLLIEALGAPSANGLAASESFRIFVYDASLGTEIEIGTVQYAASGSSFNFSPERPNSPNRNGNFSSFSINTTATGAFQCEGISRIVAFNTQLAVNQPFCTGDNAAKSAYSDGWQSGDNGGFGFNAWTLSASGSAGFFISNSASNGDGDNNGDGDINTTGIAWGTYANGGGTANAVRALAADLSPGQTFELSIDNGYLDNGASVGFGLQNSSGNNLFEFYYRGGDPVNSYKRNDNGGEQNIGLGFSDEGLRISFTLQSATSYDMTVTSLGNGATATFSGTLKNPAGGQSINRVRLFNFNSGPGSAKDAFFNSLGICYPATLVINEVDYDQPGATDDAEFIELKNVSSAAVNIDPYKLELLNAAGTVYATVELPSFSLPAGGYYVVCGNGSGVPNCNLAFAGASDQINDGAPAAIRLLRNNAITVDALSYEGSVTGATEGTGLATGDNNSTSGVGLSRVPDGNDTNNNNSDFKLSCITPGSANVGNANGDGDTYPDVCDNCPQDNNETQVDTDEDGLGDACDDCPLAVSGITNLNTGTCNCEPGYFPVTEVRNSETVIVGCSPCAPGYFCPDGMQSIPCPAGKYSNISGAVACIPCAAGYFNPIQGATECQACTAGTFSATTGSVQCTDCPAGKYSNTTASTACLSCPVGTYNNLSGATECQACAAGYFNPVEGATACQACAAGYFSATTGSAQCTACPANTYSSTTASTSCAACGSGFYSPAASNSCSTCSVSFSTTVSPVSCADTDDGQIAVINPSGGTGPYEYSIDGGTNYGPTAVFSGLTGGSYDVRVRDTYLCESSQSIAVPGNALPTISCAANLTVNTDAGQCTASGLTLTDPTVSDDCLGNALDFDGANDNVTIPGIPALTNTFTVEHYIYPKTGDSSFDRIFGTTSFYFETSRNPTSGQIQFWYVVPGGSACYWLTTPYVLPLNQWTHLAWVHDATGLKLYANGNLEYTSSGCTGIMPAATWYLGSQFGASQNGTQVLDEFRIWDVARSQSDIQATMNAEIAPQPHLVAYYKLNEGIASGNNTGLNTAPDHSGNGHSGTLNNFALNGASSNWVEGQLSSLGLNNDAPAQYNLGLNTVSWTVTDAAGQTASCQQTVTVIDNQPPSITCPASQQLPATNNLPCEALVNGIDASVTENCPYTLIYSFSGTTTGSGTGQASGQTFATGVTTVSYTATEISSGASSSCMFTVTVEPCAGLEFSGTILWEHDDVSGVKDATVNLSGAGTGSGLSDINGDYLISIPLVVGNYTVKPVKNINKTNGLTVVDAMAIQQHVTGNTPITDPYKLVAGDVNKSNSVTTLDATLIRQVLLGNPTAHAVFNTSWRFVPAAYALPPTPWGFPEKIDLTGVNSNQSGLDFTGIKLGDLVAGFANPANFGGSASVPFVWRVSDQSLEATGPLTMTVTAGAFNDLGAIQCAFQFDSSYLRFDSIQILQALPLAPGDFGLVNVGVGEIRLAWTAASNGYNLAEGAEVFRIHFDVLQTGGLLSDIVQLNDSILPGLAYTSTFVEDSVKLAFVTPTSTGGAAATQGLYLYQNRPNPMSGTTTIGFHLPKACEAQLRVLDINGRLLYSVDKFYPAGYQEEFIQLRDFRATGVLYYELTTPTNKLTRKMIAVGP